MPRTHNLTQRISPGRLAAFETLEAVAEGAYASDFLRQQSRGLAARDAGLAAQITFGTLRMQAQLDFLIESYSGRPACSLDEVVRVVLRTAIFQLRYLERIPPHAAVHESVEYIKKRRRAATGLTNAVLRKVNRDPVKWPDPATEFSLPGWLLERWHRHFGNFRAEGIARAALAEPEQYVRIRPDSAVPDELEVAGTSMPGAYRLRSPAPAGWRLHDIGSQAILPLLELTAGDTYLDLCAAPGNKTAQALEAPLALAIACDSSENRLREMPSICPKVVLDATQPLPFSARFSRIFVDAPCSGTGTVGRNPEIKWRVEESDFRRFGEKQTAILRQAVRSLLPTGKLLYATCSLEEEENEAVIQTVLKEDPSLTLERELWRLPGREEGDGFYGAVLVHALS
ncbi:MAG TPA: transcription antitermination factor NusB [Bryobacteraceae bacterium]|nr:transcription antitermination factor NusB [Bryobacteraceae bacterium]